MAKAPLLEFSAARDQILQHAKHHTIPNSESVNLHLALNRIVAKPIMSPINVPSFDNSAMDGYVIREKDVKENTTLPIAGSIFAGHNGDIQWPKNTCLRIMTGAPVPNDAYAVIMQEDVKIADQQMSFDGHNVKAGQNIRRIGENITINTEIFSTGEKLTIPKLSTLAALGLNEVCVFKALKVAIFSTGDELTPIGEPLLSANSIYDSNRYTINLMLNALGCEVIDLGIIKDDLLSITQTLKQAADLADIVITSGGVSVGDADYTKKALEQIGEINFWKIAMKPGKPFAFGKIGHAFFCGLPGNPVSSLITFYQLVRPLILSLYQQHTPSQQFTLKTISHLKKSIGRIDFQRGYLHRDHDGQLVVSSTGDQGSHITSSFNHANCFIILEKDRDNVKAGEYVTVEPFDSCLL